VCVCVCVCVCMCVCVCVRVCVCDVGRGRNYSICGKQGSDLQVELLAYVLCSIQQVHLTCSSIL
jgi:hypothetical protein